MLTNADITLFNRYYDADSDEYKYARTFLRGVNWQDSQAIDISQSAGVKSTNHTRVFIPLKVDSEEKTYLKPKTFKRSDKVTNYTLDNADIVVKGIVDFDMNDANSGGFKVLMRDFDDVMKITKVVDNRYGSKLVQHFELEVE
ncbi:MAG: hypothetical protein HXL89_01300 [[Eubacterium] sulci]|nr:hypothetical protein [[Eubacterium] sulci]MBF1181429.1 hypothetical protein [[Eubacterium] sulci]